jgi:hypothetical protein
MALRGLTEAESMALLFGNTDGEPLDYSNWRAPSMAAWCGKSRTQGAQIPRPEKDERDGDGSGWVDFKTAQARLGHSDPRLILPIYAQATEQGDRSAAEKLGAGLMASTPDHDRAAAPSTAW